MSPRPSVVFSAFRSNSDPRLQGWVAFRQSVQAGSRAGELLRAGAPARTGELARAGAPARAGELARDTGFARAGELARTGDAELVPEGRDRPRGVATVADSGHSGIWRLLASNSRELGRSSSVYATFAGARAHVLELRDQCDAMVATVVTGPSAGTHGWVVTVGERIVMTAGRWYGAASASREAAAGTIEAFRIALVAEDARHATEAGRRGTRVLSEEERAQAW
ncbi:hypothetical protein E3O44_16395 [Cryobacterium algoricola]|uniref:TrwC relaxase domain-containing protein n=1 Tax=Cryobacterium algoricola TaxID=1259183 RepID=A0ABY2IBE1_9MICO|nr:hypothetical protein [Cryobacterium algoricola]TFB84063.1 hypothetical protein E3O44_16395 [Cryobacterium algoricola]